MTSLSWIEWYVAGVALTTTAILWWQGVTNLLSML